MNELERYNAFREGKAAALTGKSEDTNDREPGTIYYDDWADGWQEGDRERNK